MQHWGLGIAMCCENIPYAGINALQTEIRAQFLPGARV